jgi:type II secretory pathway pseudopilin PulG
MSLRSRPLVVVLAVAVFALVGVGAALAVTKSGGSQNRESGTAQNQQQNQQQQQQQQQQQDQQQRDDKECDREGGMFRGGPGGGPAEAMASAADYLGLSTDQLLTRLRNGQSLADIAKAQGKSVSGMKSAMLADATSRLEAAVKSGDMTEAQKNQILDMLRSNADAILNGNGPFGGGPPPGFGDRRGGDWDGPPMGSFGGGAPSSGNGNASYGPPAGNGWA